MFAPPFAGKKTYDCELKMTFTPVAVPDRPPIGGALIVIVSLTR